MFGVPLPLPLWAIKAIGGVLLALALAGAGARLAHNWYAPQLKGYKQQAAATQSQARATAKVQTMLTKVDAPAEAKAQTAISRQTQIIIKEVPVYVSSSPLPPVGCVTNGMLRLHDAAVLGIDAAGVPPPARQSDASCSTTSPSDFMAGIVNNYASARANAEQLNSLEADIKARADAIAPTPEGG